MEYRHLPVVILSESDDPMIANECYALDASSFIQKPDALNSGDPAGRYKRVQVCMELSASLPHMGKGQEYPGVHLCRW